MTATYAPIRDKIERAARNNERLHLEPEQVRLLVRSPLFGMLAELVAKEFAALWEDESQVAARPPATTTPPVFSSGHSGSIIAPNAISGSSPGMTKGPLDEAVERAERQQALAAVNQVGRRRRRKTL